MSDRIEQLRLQAWNFPLSRRVAQALIAENAEFRKLSIEARGKVVVLHGIVEGDEARDTVLAATREVEGVGEIVDRITVRRRSSVAKKTYLDIPVEAPLPEEPLWQRAVAPLALFSVLIPALFSLYYLGTLTAGEFGGGRDLTAVEGSVFAEGKPASGAQLILYPLDGVDTTAGRPTATVGPDGVFRLQTDGLGDGAAPGRYAVTVRSASQKIDARYARPLSTPLSIEIAPSSEVLRLSAFHLAGEPAPSRTARR